ncbi:purine-cytosine permease [Coprinopsis cinerea okayama7|uniref:Purine-cytosine permease n=1 Tax=Coprinopsis cinerea (strain Okayama-7 / 130 / ATCC MYA-4618 / FGSC 9003) TaxID=240176 RepID=A8PC78_COPC7|nr:purine-cytosine permease [Coprinopsis cinerea okayama7\|eukprot:XP_001840334.1 purine-cytosine permease [Coprinopsis cinerea okayama7\
MSQLEKGLEGQEEKVVREKSPSPTVESVPSAVYSDKWTKRLLKFGVEDRGIQPVPEERRTDTQFFKVFFIWFSWNINILTFSAGTLGPVVFGLSLRDTCLIILFFSMFFCIFPAYVCTWGPKLGMRTMVISRYSFGYYGVIPLSVFNLITMLGFSVLNAILGGQALASITNGLSWTVGIVVISLISLLVSFGGYNVLNWYERIAWIPVVITFIIALGIGGKHLSSPPAAEPATVSSVLSFASTLAGFAITFTGVATDFAVYYRHDVSGWRIFIYSYIGLLVPIVTLQSLGAAVAVAASTSVPEWQQAYEGGDVGGLLHAMLSPVGGFGKFLTVLLALSVAGNICATAYSASITLQAFAPWLVVVPRYVFAIITTGIVVALAIPGAHRFYDTLVNFLGLIGYWASAFIAVLLVEHHYFRKNDPRNYDAESWDTPSKLPSGIAAIAACLMSVALIVPCMHQVWFTGPIAEKTGDIGFEVAFVITVIFYVPFRMIERRIQGRL